MRSGYVLHFSDRTFGEFMEEAIDIQIHDQRYTAGGTSKANKLRTFWKVEDDVTVGRCLEALLEHWTSAYTTPTDEQLASVASCRTIAARLLAGSARLDVLKTTAVRLDAAHLSDQIRRIEQSITADPPLAIGTAKELVETVCRTILSERGKPVEGAPDLAPLVKSTLRELKLVPDAIPESAKGAETIKRLLSNLATVTQGLAELRNLYGTGHGREGRTTAIKPRHAKLAVAASAALATFLFETHVESTR